MDDSNEWMNKVLRKARSTRVRLLDDTGRVEVIDDPARDGEPVQQQEPPATRPQGDADQGARGTGPTTSPDMNRTLRGLVRRMRTPIIDPDERR
jgi:hypothetical protein